MQSEIAPGINPKLKESYIAAQITNDCWQATPGKTIDLVRNIGISKGGSVEEDCEIIDVEKRGSTYSVLAKNHRKEYVEYETPVFVNAMGAEGDIFAT